MTTTIADVRGALKNCVETISGLRGAAYIQDAINAPIAHIVPLEFDPRLVFNGSKTEYHFQIRVYVPRAAADQGQALLDGYREVSGSTSITAAVQNDTNWGAVDVDYALVTRVSPVSVVEVVGVPYLYLEIDVEVCW